MKYVLIVLLALATAISASAGFFGSKTVEAGTVSPKKDYDSVNGAIKVGENSEVGDLSTVNGSVKVGENSIVGMTETVNGSIVIGAGSKTLGAETVNGSIKMHNDCHIDGDVETVNGSIKASNGCKIEGHIETVNGKISLDNTTVFKDVVMVSGKIELLNSSLVDGDLIVKKSKGFFNQGKKKAPIVVLGEGAQVGGDLVFERPVKLYIHDSLNIDTDISNAKVERFDSLKELKKTK